MALSQIERKKIKEQKNALRLLFKDKRRHLPQNYRHVLDKLLCKTITECDAIRYADTVLLFSPIKDEPNVSAIAKTFFSCGKKIAFPVCLTDTLSLEFRYVHGIQELEKSSYGILEPTGKLPALTDFSGAVCLVPALAFDRQGFRIGYGKGYYDRFLSEHSVKSIGVAYSDFVIDKLPRYDTDVAVEYIATEGGIIKTNEKKSSSCNGVAP